MKLAGIVSVLALLLFYVLPKLVSQLWLIEPEEENIQNPKYHEPMRVQICGFMLSGKAADKGCAFFDRLETGEKSLMWK